MPESETKKAVLTLVNNTSHRLKVTIYLPKKYCPADGFIIGKSVEKDKPLINFEGSGLWWLNTIRRSSNGIKVSIESIFKGKQI